jgi:hypothetical protein
VPSVYACYRFAVKLRTFGDMLDRCIARVIVGLHAECPDMGRDIAIDGSDMPAYANGQRHLFDGGPERERFSDPDASWGTAPPSPPARTAVLRLQDRHGGLHRHRSTARVERPHRTR